MVIYLITESANINIQNQKEQLQSYPAEFSHSSFLPLGILQFLFTWLIRKIYDCRSPDYCF